MCSIAPVSVFTLSVLAVEPSSLHDRSDMRRASCRNCCTVESSVPSPTPPQACAQRRCNCRRSIPWRAHSQRVDLRGSLHLPLQAPRARQNRLRPWIAARNEWLEDLGSLLSEDLSRLPTDAQLRCNFPALNITCILQIPVHIHRHPHVQIQIQI